MRFDWPKARILSIGVAHEPSLETGMSRTITSSHAFARSGAHHTDLDLDTEASERIGYRNTKTVTSFTPVRSRSKRLQ